MGRFKSELVDLENEKSYETECYGTRYTDIYETMASALADVQKAERKKKKAKKNAKKQKEKKTAAENECRRVKKALQEEKEKRILVESKLREEQIRRDFDKRVFEQQLKYECLLAEKEIQASSREMNLIAAMQHPEICEKLVDKFVAVVRETINDNCMIEGDANEI